MERRQSSTTDLPSVLGKSSSSCDRGECREKTSVDQTLAAVMLPGRSSRREAGVLAPGRDTPARDVFLPSDCLRDQLQGIRRRLWIINTTLESLPAKIEQTYRKRSSIVGGNGSDQAPITSDLACDEPLALEGRKAIGGWWARWKLTKLRSRANRAERRAAAALYDASVSFGEALEAVLHAAVARVKADEASVQSPPPSSSAEVRPGR